MAKMRSKVCQFIGLLVAVCCLHELFNHYVSCPLSCVDPIKPVIHTDTLTVETTKRESVKPPSGRVHACVFSGRWMYLRILLPYLYRELQQNGGVVDRVVLVMIGYTEETEAKLKIFVAAANRVLKDEAFQFLYLKERADEAGIPANLFPIFPKFYYAILQRLLRNPSDVYFKMDDDIVYLHPNIFSNMLKNKNTSECFLHYGNIVTNWRCNWLHQKIGVFDDEVNPKGLKFDYATDAACGWRRTDCAEMALRAFLHHYHKQQLDKYLFRGRDPVATGVRFSINFLLLDVDIVDFQRMMQTGEIQDDEIWLSIHYSSKAPQPNCIVGQGLVVHFAYGINVKEILDLGLLKPFENIVRIEVGRTLPKKLWRAADFS